jgi:ornithine cyclodeaminase/alanine dehydrogenase-like protein (mu-crystallin family)
MLPAHSIASPFALGVPVSASIRHITAAEVHAALEYPALIDALRAAFAAGAEVPLRSSHSVTPEGDRLLLMPAWRAGEDLGVKLVTVFPRNPQRGLPSVSALYVLLDGATGHPRMLIDGEALTLRRTAAASALASTFLSRPDSSRLLVVGTGALAPYMAAAHCAVRPVRKVLVWGRSFQRAADLAARLSIERCTCEPVESLARGLAEADIVTCATTAREPVVCGEFVRAGTHVDLVGAFTREMRECDDTLVKRSAVFVDTYAGTLKEAGDLVQPLEAGVIRREHILAELSDLVTSRHPGRTGPDQVTLFKSVGSALEDLCAARLVFDRCG